jgi:hypothetical protein
LSAALGLLVLLLLAGTAVVAAATIGVRSLGELVLAAYVVATAEIVALALVLSLFGSMTRTALVAGCAACLAASVGAWLLAGAPRLPALPFRAVGSLARPWPLLLVAACAAGSLAYVLALIVGTPPNGWDQLNYHLPRAAFWVQADGVGYLDHAYDERINFFPPNGEIPIAFVLGVTRTEELGALVQLAAALAAATGVFVLSRRLGLDRRAAAFGAFLFLTLPIVLLQSATTKNDMVVAALLVAATVFLLGDSRRQIALASVAVALAVGTKFTAAYGVVLLLVLALVAAPRALRRTRVVALALGALAGCYWYAVNLAETGLLLGDQSNIPGLTAPLRPRENLVTAFGDIVDLVDVSGAKGADILLYLVAALAVGIGLALASRRRGSSNGSGLRQALVAALLVASPLALLVLADEVGRPSLLWLHDALGEPEAYLAEGDEVTSSPTTASDTGSWFGPAGLFLVLGAGAAGVVLARRRSLPAVALVAATAPLLWLVLIALSLTYHPWQGRFFLYPVALSAALWGLALRVRPLAWSVAALAATTAFLSLVHYTEKPSGLRLLERDGPTSIWQLERSQAQSLHDPAYESLFRFLDQSVPRDASVALAFGANDFGFPIFGPRLERRVVPVPFGSNAAEIDAEWLVASPDRAGEIDPACWTRALESEGGTIFERTPDCR